MRNLQVLFFAICYAFSSPLAAPKLPQGVTPRAPLSVQLGTIRLRSASLFDALVAARQRNPKEILFGFVEPATEQQRVSLSLDSTTLGDYLVHLRRRFPGYSLVLDDNGIVHVEPQSASRASDILQMRVAHFRVHDHRTIEDVISRLTLEIPELRLLVYPHQGGTLGAAVSGGMEPKLDFEASNVTVRQLLDRLCLYSAELSKQAENRPKFGPPPSPVSWKFSFHEDPNAANSLGGYPEFSTF